MLPELRPSTASTSVGDVKDLILYIRVADGSGLEGLKCLRNTGDLRFRAEVASEHGFRRATATVRSKKQWPPCLFDDDGSCGAWEYAIAIHASDIETAAHVYVMVDDSDGSHIAELVGNPVAQW